VQRRSHVRFQIWFPVQLDGIAQAKIAMTHNTSASGMLVAVASQLTVGEPVELHFRMPPSGAEHRLTGRVLRIEPNKEDPQGAWPFRAAIAFDEVAEQLQPLLEEAAARLESVQAT
jgi:PilZ domain